MENGKETKKKRSFPSFLTNLELIYCSFSRYQSAHRRISLQRTLIHFECLIGKARKYV